VEVERARLTKRVADKLEAEGKLDEARTLIMELQVETYGSMEVNEKVHLLSLGVHNYQMKFTIIINFRTSGQIPAPPNAPVHRQGGLHPGDDHLAEDQRQIL
jgi:hypothetical protein